MLNEALLHPRLPFARLLSVGMKLLALWKCSVRKGQTRQAHASLAHEATSQEIHN